MGNLTDTKSTWTLGVQRSGNGLPIFAWGRGDLKGVSSPVSFAAQTGNFLLRLPRQEAFSTQDVMVFRRRLETVGLSEPPELRRVQEVYERFEEMIESVGPERAGEFYDQLEYEWRKLLASPYK